MYIDRRVVQRYYCSRMICQRCQRSLRSNDGLKCCVCESKYHLKCVSTDSKQCDRDFRECGDLEYQWKCALCLNSLSKSPDNYCKEHLINAINTLSEKLDIVKKIHLPKFNGELLEIKSVTDRIVKQNDDILRKMDEIENKKNYEKRCCGLSHSYRKRNLNFTGTSRKAAVEHNDYMSMSFPSEKTVRYHTRRRPYLLKGMLRLLKRRSNKTNALKKIPIKS